MHKPSQNIISKTGHLLSSIKFDRNEWSGAFGDIGTDLPLIIGMIIASNINPASVLTVFGLAQIFTAVFYRMPMPVQPLKAVATLVIASNISGSVIYGAGLAIGLIMLVLTITGLVEKLAIIIPKCVIRGIQFGLGIKLAILALGYVLKDGIPGYILAGICFVIIICLMGNRKYPPAAFVITLGLIYALIFRLNISDFHNSFGIKLPEFFVPTGSNILEGFLVLALTQIPLSLGNSIFATSQLANDLYPEKKITVRKIGTTYSFLNLLMPFIGGIPVCHGSGGLAGHHAFGGRTGGSVIIYGMIFITVGLFFSNGFEQLINIFPYPVLGIILLFEGLALARLIRDTASKRSNFAIAILVGLMAVGLPYGFLIGMVTGTVLSFVSNKYSSIFTKQ